MAQKTLFTVLLGQPWWISALAGVALFGIAQLAFPPIAPWVALPFMVIAAVVAWKQMRTVAPGQVDERLTALRAMSWDNFSNVIENAYRREGYEITAVKSDAYDYALSKQGRVTLLQCRRWKGNQLGVGPLQDLAKAIGAKDAANGICITAGDISPRAAEFAAANPISIVSGAALAQLVGSLKAAARR